MSQRDLDKRLTLSDDEETGQTGGSSAALRERSVLYCASLLQGVEAAGASQLLTEQNLVRVKAAALFGC